MSGHKWSALQRKRFIRTMRLRRRNGDGDAYVLRGNHLRPVKRIAVIHGKPVYA